MTLNTDFAGATLMPGRRGVLQGTDRGLDGLIGLVIVVATVMIGFLSVYALYDAGNAAVSSKPSSASTVAVGFAIAFIGSSIVVGITTLIYLIRMATGRRSWRAPLWGAVLMTVLLIIGYLIMVAA